MARIKGKRVLVYLILTFGLTWGLMYLAAMREGGNASANSALPPAGMLIPAFTAISLDMFFFKDSKIYYKKYTQHPRLIFQAFLLITVLTSGLTILGTYTTIAPSVLAGIGNLLFVLWTLLVIQLYGRSGEDCFKRGGLQLGNTSIGVKIGVGMVLFFLLQAGSNWVFGLGKFQGIQASIEGIPIPRFIYPIALMGFFALAIIGSPLGGLAATFGEEYGWRGYLQRELSGLGLRTSATLIGLIWGIWHTPIILSGAHTYPPTASGFACAAIFFSLWGIVQSYAVLKTGSIWAAAFLHGVVNNVYAFTLNYLVRPYDKLNSFGLGVYGLICLAAVVVVILRDPIWKMQPKIYDTSIEEHEE